MRGELFTCLLPIVKAYADECLLSPFRKLASVTHGATITAINFPCRVAQRQPRERLESAVVEIPLSVTLLPLRNPSDKFSVRRLIWLLCHVTV